MERKNAANNASVQQHSNVIKFLIALQNTPYTVEQNAAEHVKEVASVVLSQNLGFGKELNNYILVILKQLEQELPSETLEELESGYNIMQMKAFENEIRNNIATFEKLNEVLSSDKVEMKRKIFAVFRILHELNAEATFQSNIRRNAQTIKHRNSGNRVIADPLLKEWFQQTSVEHIVLSATDTSKSSVEYVQDVESYLKSLKNEDLAYFSSYKNVIQLRQALTSFSRAVNPILNWLDTVCIEIVDDIMKVQEELTKSRNTFPVLERIELEKTLKDFDGDELLNDQLDDRTERSLKEPKEKAKIWEKKWKELIQIYYVIIGCDYIKKEIRKKLQETNVMYKDQQQQQSALLKHIVHSFDDLLSKRSLLHELYINGYNAIVDIFKQHAQDIANGLKNMHICSGAKYKIGNDGNYWKRTLYDSNEIHRDAEKFAAPYNNTSICSSLPPNTEYLIPAISANRKWQVDVMQVHLESMLSRGGVVKMFALNMNKREAAATYLKRRNQTSFVKKSRDYDESLTAAQIVAQGREDARNAFVFGHNDILAFAGNPNESDTDIQYKLIGTKTSSFYVKRIVEPMNLELAEKFLTELSLVSGNLPNLSVSVNESLLKFRGGRPGRRSKQAHVKTNQIHLCNDGVKRVVYTKNSNHYVKRKSAKTGKFTYRPVKKTLILH